MSLFEESDLKSRLHTTLYSKYRICMLSQIPWGIFTSVGTTRGQGIIRAVVVVLVVFPIISELSKKILFHVGKLFELWNKKQENLNLKGFLFAFLFAFFRIDF